MCQYRGLDKFRAPQSSSFQPDTQQRSSFTSHLPHSRRTSYDTFVVGQPRPAHTATNYPLPAPDTYRAVPAEPTHPSSLLPEAATPSPSASFPDEHTLGQSEPVVGNSPTLASAFVGAELDEELFTLQSVLYAAQQLQVEEPDLVSVPCDAKLGDGVGSEVMAEQEALLAARQLIGDAIFSLEVAVERNLLSPSSCTPSLAHPFH